VTISEEGKVISAKATSGPSMLRIAGETAAMRSKFKPILAGNQAVKATGFIVYNFVNKF
jgi:protein TonB